MALKLFFEEVVLSNRIKTKDDETASRNEYPKPDLGKAKAKRFG
jgi:hypothetical protein